MTTTEGPKRTAGRKKATTDIGKQMLNRERRRLAREQASESEEMVLEYRRQLEHRERKMEGVNDPQRQTQRAIDRGLVKRVAGVLASEDLTFKLEAHPSVNAKSSAWTDFKVIDITYGMFKDHKGVPNFRMIAANFRGLAYHEGGHLKWTIPFRNLITLVTGEESNRYDHLQKSWNILEDQRMETAVMSDSPSKAKYFLPMVMEHNCSTNAMLALNYPYIVWRKYLPAKVRRQGRKLFLESHKLMTEELCLKMEAIIESYVRATTAQQLFQAVVDFDALWKAYINPAVPNDASHRHMERDIDDEMLDEMLDIPIPPDFAEPEPEVPTKGGADAEGDGGGTGESDDAKAEGGEGAGSGSSPDVEPDLTDVDLHDMLAEAEEARDADRVLDHDELAMHEAIQDFGSTLPTYSTGVNTNSETQAMADNLAYEVENSFHAATMDKSPAWVEQQNRGIINVLRYKTRESGQTDFYRQWTDDDQPGFNISVSVLLDYSGSMLSVAEELAVAGYATKQSCQRLGIPCTVVLWNSQAKLLWDHNDKADFIPIIVPNGSTNPGEALDDLFTHRFDKPIHVVLIMTDGAWSGDTAFGDYRQEGTSFIVLSYDKTIKTANQRADQIRSYGADVSVGIDNLMQIPRILEQALADAVMAAR